MQSSYKELREKAGVSTLYVNRLRTAMCEMYKVVHGLAPPIIANRFKLVSSVSSQSKRSSCSLDLYQPLTKLQVTKHSFVVRGVMVWNGIPYEVQCALTLKEFRNWLFMIC